MDICAMSTWSSSYEKVTKILLHTYEYLCNHISLFLLQIICPVFRTVPLATPLASRGIALSTATPINLTDSPFPALGLNRLHWHCRALGQACHCTSRWRCATKPLESFYNICNKLRKPPLPRVSEYFSARFDLILESFPGEKQYRTHEQPNRIWSSKNHCWHRRLIPSSKLQTWHKPFRTKKIEES